MNLLRLITFRKGAAGLDPDAQAFLTAIGNTDPTIETAINDLVIDLKNYGLWTKMTAIYPMVGGTASAHSYNLKDTAQYQITWNGTLTHDSDGVTGNGSNGYGDTGLTPSSVLSQNDMHMASFASNVTLENSLDMGSSSDGSQTNRNAFSRRYGVGFEVYCGVNQNGWDTNSTGYDPYNGLVVLSRTGSSGSDLKYYLNGSSKLTGSTASSGLSNKPIFVCGYNLGGSLNSPSSYTFSFFSIGSGLNATEASDLYTAVQDFQIALAQPNDADALSFINAAQIPGRTQMSAVNQLVLDLKSYSLWSKMAAIYPFVGGSPFSHSYNLKDTTQYQIIWNGSVTHNSNGITGAGGYGDLVISGTNLNHNSNHFGIYSRTNSTVAESDMGNLDNSVNGSAMSIKWSDNNTYYSNFDNVLSGAASVVTDSRGLFVVNRETSTTREFLQNGANLTTATVTANSSYGYKFIICGRWNPNANSAQFTSTRNYAFCCLGDGLTSSENSDLYTAVQAFQTTLGRQV